ncbi:MAG TPA: CHASE2 domain-containing protein [Nostocaceae cyanobacterium]|nr:CHASE2 domain-containing protein [Nostocaceae cyanobacterium]
MAEEPISTLTKKSAVANHSSSSKFPLGMFTGSIRPSHLINSLGHLLAGSYAIVAALLSVWGGDAVQLLEKQTPSIFFQMRGPITTPEDIVIVAIDDQSISIPKQYYRTNPQQYAELEPLTTFPYKRQAYSQIITKLMAAGARTVALDLVFDQPSSSEESDRQLQAVLAKYGSKVTLAAVYENSSTHQGEFWQLTQPHTKFNTGAVSIGSVNFPVEIDGKIHSLASEFNNRSGIEELLPNKIPSFGEAVLTSAQIKYNSPKGKYIYFWGSTGSFTTIPLWYVLDDDNWNGYLQQGKFFQDKIVLIGYTAKLDQKDVHPVAFSQSWPYPETMPGVEIHANAIATLMHNKSIALAIEHPVSHSLFVLLLVGSSVWVVARTKQGIKRLLLSLILASVWGGISYISFIHGQLIFPTTIPMIAIACAGISYLGVEVAAEKIKKQKLMMIFQKYQSSPVIQEIISQQDDLQDFIQQRNLAINGKILSGRYKISKVLGAGGFSETYIAEDIQRPGNPQCVVKQLKLSHHAKPESLELARRLFSSEAKILEKLGTHNQIPQLLAYFEEEQEFYLVQEYIIGHPLHQEFASGQVLSETVVIEILKDILGILVFVHSNGVIHRDIKPNNIIRRNSDWKLVLIDFGAVKEVSTQIFTDEEQSAFTIGIGTKGYAPSEQCFGRPQYNSDIYALGMIGIRALTGIAPHELNKDIDDEIIWTHKARVSKPLAEILNKMISEDYHQRYQSASEVLTDLDNINNLPIQPNLSSNYSKLNTLSIEDDSDNPTATWEQ